MSSAHPKIARVQTKWMEPRVFVAVISIISAFILKYEFVESRPPLFMGSGENWYLENPEWTSINFSSGDSHCLHHTDEL